MKKMHTRPLWANHLPHGFRVKYYSYKFSLCYVWYHTVIGDLLFLRVIGSGQRANFLQPRYRYIPYLRAKRQQKQKRCLSKIYNCNIRTLSNNLSKSAGEGIRTPAGTKPTSYLAILIRPTLSKISRLAR
jgi:hypothetical protein